MKINHISKTEFNQLVYKEEVDFLRRIHTPEIFVVKNFYDSDEIKKIRNVAFDLGQQTEASWHPLIDGCPDYHRLHDNYLKAHVKQKFHGFYYHSYFAQNKNLFNFFKEIFDVKCHLGKFALDNFANYTPSSGVVARVNLHHYPKGGGYQAEHIDPSGSFAVIQTLLIASKKGIDYRSGGVFARAELGSNKIYLDDFVDIGDLLVLSPAIPHGVDPIDPEDSYSSESNNGRWIILPLFLHSDSPNVDSIKPYQIA
jgi:hypothetical protein